MLQEWAAAHPLAGVPGIDLAAGAARRAGTLTPTAAVAEALDNGTAAAVPGIRDTLFSEGRWLAPAASGWIEIPELERRLPAPPTEFGQASVDSEGNQPDPWTMT